MYGKVNFLTLFILLSALLSASCYQEVVHKPSEPKEALIYAAQLVEEEEYEEAREMLIAVKNRDTTKEYSTVAQIKIAESFYKEGEIELAVEEYKRFLRLYPDNKYATYAQYQIAMTWFYQIEGADRGYRAAAKAMREFKRLNRMFPRNPYRDIIPLRIEKCRNILAAHEHYVAEFYYKKKSYNAALGRLNTIMSDYEDYKAMTDVHFLTAMSYKGLDMRDKAMEFFEKTLESATDPKLIKKVKKERRFK